MKQYLKFLSLFLALAGQSSAQAQSVRPSGYQDLNEYVLLFDAIFAWFFYFILIISVLALVWAAWTYLTAGDDEQKLSKAKHTIIYALIALVIAFLANGIPSVIQTLLGV